jgi:hypothetical protein
MSSVPEPARSAPALRRRWPEGVVVVVAVVAFAALGGAIGVGVGFLAAVVWYVSDVPYAIAVGSVGLVVLLPAHELAIAVVATLLAALVAATVVTWGASSRVLAASVIAPLGLGWMAWAGAASLPLWLAAAFLLGAIGFAGYVRHRLALAERERFGSNENVRRAESDTDVLHRDP